MQTVLAQLLSFIPKREFRRLVEKHGGDHNTRTFSCWDQLTCMIISQLAKKESLREIETCVRGMGKLLYHTGVRGKVSKTSLAYANEKRSSQIYAELCQILIKQTRALYVDDNFVKELDSLVYVIDSTLISLSLSICPWAYFGGRPQAGIKVHTQLDLRGSIPSFLHISRAKMTDNLFLDYVVIEAGAFYIMDKAYFDLKRLYRIHAQRGYFVTRCKSHVKLSRVRSNPREKSSSILSDKITRFTSKFGKRNYPEHIRRIRYRDQETGKVFCFLTNNFKIPAATIAALYKARWQIEIFFKWVKQNLRLNSFLGNSPNAIEIQIYTAVASFLCVAIAKKTLHIQASLTEIIQFLPQALFLKVPIYKAFNNPDSITHPNYLNSTANQLDLF